ncbi:MAG: hypothetical protein COA69_11735 [Robiginitomaculum sp.]|nr:MAG: hypothetical protein COA69_11735 [Robiginitomaculum sp.]
MSILTKKISAVTTVAESYAALGGQLDVVKKALLEVAQPFTETVLGEGGGVAVSGTYKAILENSDAGAPCFVLGTENFPNLAVLQFSRPLAQMTCKKKLGTKDAKASDTVALELLDLILMQSAADKILEALKASLGSEVADLKYRGRHLSIEDVTDIDEREKWLQLTLPLIPKEDLGKKAKKTAVDISITFLFSALMADTLVKAVNEGAGDLVIDRANPWSAHMHGTVMQSTLPLKVIVEILDMSVADCTRLKLGQTIALPGASHKYLSVSTETKTGLVSLAKSTLGVSKSNKAVKLLDDIDPGFLSNIGSVMLG